MYYSIGEAASESQPFLGIYAFEPVRAHYKSAMATDVFLVDESSLKAYSPVWDADTTFASSQDDLNSKPGELRVGWAMFPELPAGTTTVQVLMTAGNGVRDIPGEDGPLLPVGADPAPLLGQGWPKVPQGAELSRVDPAAVTWSLTRRSGDVSGATKVEESPTEVAVTLDSSVLFATGSADLSAEAQAVLEQVALDIAARGTGGVVVTGHTDFDGSDASNQVLSEARAASVLAVLQPASGSKVTFTSVGKGESEPVAENSTDEGKQANRRVTVVYQVTGRAK